jgi:hypothetical protein
MGLVSSDKKREDGAIMAAFKEPRSPGGFLPAGVLPASGAHLFANIILARKLLYITATIMF